MGEATPFDFRRTSVELKSHSFKGTDLTFLNFPARLQHILSETLDNVKVECIVFPAYEVPHMSYMVQWATILTIVVICIQDERKLGAHKVTPAV